MSKQKKIISLMAVALSCFVMAIMTALPVNLAKATVTEPTMASFKMVDGAQLRTTGQNGIRFATQISSEDYSGLNNYYPGKTIKFGTIVAKSSNANISKDTLIDRGEKFESTIWDSELNPETASTTYQYNLAILDFDDANLNKYYYALGYVEVYNGESLVKTYYAEQPTSRTPMQVASKYIAGKIALDELDETAPDQGYVLTIIDKVMSDKQIAFAETEYNVGISNSITPVVSVGGVAVTAHFTFTDAIAKVENGAIVGVSSGTTTVTATVKGATRDYICTATLNVARGEVEPTIDKDGVLDTKTKGEQTEVKVNGTKVDNTYDGNIVNYIFAKNDIYSLTQTTPFEITVESASYVGSTTYTVVALTNENFIEEINKVTCVEDNYNKYLMLVEDITIAGYVSSQNKGDMTNEYSVKDGNNTHIGYMVFDKMYAWVDGRGYSISWTSNHASHLLYTGLAENFYGKLVNINFNITVNGMGVLSRTLFVHYMKADATGTAGKIENCYFDIEVIDGTDTATIFYSATAGTIANCVFDVESNVNYFILSYPAKGSTFTDCIVVTNYQASYVQKITQGVVKLYAYDSMTDAYDGVEGKYYYANGGTIGYAPTACWTKAGVEYGTVSIPAKAYNSWNEVWSFGSDAITLCGKNVWAKQQTTLAVSAEGILTFNTNGTPVTLYATVGSAEEVVIATNVVNSYDIGAYAAQNGWLSAEGTIVALRVDGDYYGTVEHTFTKLVAEITIDEKGIVNCDTGDETSTLYIDGVEIEGATLPFDLTDWAFKNGLTGDKTYTIGVESESFVAEEVTKSYVAISTSNFVSTLKDVTTADTYYYLTENVALTGYTSASSLGDMTIYKEESSYKGYFVFDSMLATLDGRGHSISYTTSFGSYGLYGLIYTHLGTWMNIKFNISANNGNFNRCSFIASMSNGTKLGVLENCYINFSTTSNTGGSFLMYNANGIIKDTIFKLNTTTSSSVRITHHMVKNGTSGNISHVEIRHNAPLLPLESLNAVALNVYQYCSLGDFISGANGYYYSCSSNAIVNDKGEGLANKATNIGTAEVPVTVYGDWSKVWDIKSSAITLCGITVWEKESASLAVAVDGTVTYSTASENATLTINETVIENAKSGFNLTDYALNTLKITDKTSLVVKVESASYASELTIKYVPLTNTNFVSTLRGVSVNNPNEIYCLTENITIKPWNGSSDKGDFTQSYLNEAIGLFASMYANVDGRGYSINLTYGGNDASGHIGEFICANYATWCNVVFNANVSANGGATFRGGVLTYNATGIFENCLVNITADTSLKLRAFGSFATGDKVSNTIVIINNEGTGAGYFALGALRGETNNCVLISNKSDLHIVNGKSNYLYFKIVDCYSYAGYDTFVSGGDSLYYKQNGNSNAVAGSAYTGIVYNGWDSVWSITESGITLCGKTAYTVPTTPAE